MKTKTVEPSYLDILIQLKKDLDSDDDEAVVMLRELVVAGRGGDNGNRYTKKDDSSNADNISIAKDLFVDPEPAKKKADAGTSRAYTLTRLKKERPDLFDRVCAKELSANAAAIEAGWRKKATHLDTLQRAWQKASAEEQRQFLEWISNT